MGWFKKIFKRSVREADTYAFMAESPWLRNDFIGEKKNMEFDLEEYNYTYFYCATSDETRDFIHTLIRETNLRQQALYFYGYELCDYPAGCYFYHYVNDGIQLELSKTFYNYNACNALKWSDFMKDEKFTKMEFDFEKYRGLYVMHCRTEKEANDFCRVMHEDGRRWRAGDSYLTETYWSSFSDDGVYYNFNNGAYSYNRSDYCSPNITYTILEWSDFMKDKKFTKADLKNGDVVKCRNEKTYIVCVDTDTIICQSGSWLKLSDLQTDLIYDHGRFGGKYDIMQVRRPTKPNHCRFSIFRTDEGDLVYDRERDDPEVEEMTMEDVCKALGKRVKIVARK